MPRSVLLLLLAPALALAQRGPAAPAGPPAAPAAAMSPEAADRYHEAARLYVDGQTAPALAAAEAAVALAPGNRRAVALRDLIKEQQDQQNQQQQDQPQDQPQDGQQPPDPDGDDPGQPPPSGQNGQQPPPDEGSPAPSDRAGEPRDGMTRDQAERILDAVGGDERDLLRRFRREPSRVRTNEQDW